MRPSSRRVTLLDAAELCAAGAATLFLGARHLVVWTSAGPFWRDEVNGLRIAGAAGMGAFWDRLATESFPPLFPALLRAWTSLVPETSELGVRALGLLIGLLVLAGLWVCSLSLGRNRGARTVPVVSLVLLGANVVVLMWGDSIRAYGLGLALILWTMAAFWRLSLEPKPFWILAASALAVLSCQCLYQNAAVLPGLGLAAAAAGLARRDRRAVLAALGATALGLASLLPYAGLIAGGEGWRSVMRTEVPAWYPVAVLGSSLGSPAEWFRWLWLAFTGLGLGGLFLSRQGGSDREDLALVLYLALSVSAGLAGWAVFHSAARVPVALWHVLPVLGILAAALDGFCLAGCARPQGLRLARLALAGLALGLAAKPLVGASRERRTSMDLAAAWLERSAGPRDLIIVHPWSFGVAFAWHYRGKTPWLTVPPLEDSSVHRYDLIHRAMAEPDPLKPLRDRADAALKSGRTVWWVGALPPQGIDAAGMPPPTPEELATWRWASATVHFLRSRAPEWAAIDPAGPAAVNPLERVQVFVLNPRRAASRQGKRHR